MAEVKSLPNQASGLHPVEAGSELQSTAGVATAQAQQIADAASAEAQATAEQTSRSTQVIENIHPSPKLLKCTTCRRIALCPLVN